MTRVVSCPYQFASQLFFKEHIKLNPFGAQSQHSEDCISSGFSSREYSPMLQTETWFQLREPEEEVKLI